MAFIILEGYHLNRENEMRSEFYLIDNPFSTEKRKISKKDAVQIIIDNDLHVVLEDGSGRIWDTLSGDFRKRFAVSEQGLDGEPRKKYREFLYRTLEKVWGS